MFSVARNSDIRDSISVCKYADDCTLYEAIPSNEASQLQLVLDSLITWSHDNKMMINPTKTKKNVDMFYQESTSSQPYHPE